MISLLQQDSEWPQVDTANADLSGTGKDLLPWFNLVEEISELEV